MYDKPCLCITNNAMRLYKPQAAMATNVQRSAGDLVARTGATAANVAKVAKVAVAVKVAKVSFNFRKAIMMSILQLYMFAHSIESCM